MNQSTLSTQIRALTQVIDDLEVMESDLGGRVTPQITSLHAILDDLNTTYAELDDAARYDAGR